jgi:hypothetical protein
MFKFLVGVAFGAAGYWAWQSFGRDLLGLGSDQDAYSTSYSSNTSFGGSNTGYGTGASSSPSSTGAGTSSESPTSASS